LSPPGNVISCAALGGVVVVAETDDPLSIVVVALEPSLAPEVVFDDVPPAVVSVFSWLHPISRAAAAMAQSQRALRFMRLLLVVRGTRGRAARNARTTPAG
jgi:hypothetical protein